MGLVRINIGATWFLLVGYFVSDIAIFVLKRDVKLQLTNSLAAVHSQSSGMNVDEIVRSTYSQSLLVAVPQT